MGVNTVTYHNFTGTAAVVVDRRLKGSRVSATKRCKGQVLEVALTMDLVKYIVVLTVHPLVLSFCQSGLARGTLSCLDVFVVVAA